MKRLTLPNYVMRTGTQYESTERFLQNASVVKSSAENLCCSGVPMTHIGDDTYALSKEELHCFIIGDSGCGKTRRVILPTISLMAKSGESMVVSDPKGELYRSTSKQLEAQGYDVMVLNFRNPSRGSRWNPLSIIEKSYRSGDQEEKDRATLMLKDIVDIMKKEGESEKDRFWENAAAKVFIGVALLIMEYGDLGTLTFENISSVSKVLISGANESGDKACKIKGKKGQSIIFTEFLEDLPLNSPINENLHAFVTMPANTRNSVAGILENMVSAYTNQESLQNLFSASDIDVSQLGKKPTALFFILPDDSGALYPIATVFVKQIYTTLVNLADSNSSGKLDNRVTFLLDEFANFAPIPSIDAMLTAARSRGIRYVLVCQSMEQLVDKYKASGAEILLANCRLWIYMSCRNLPFLERLERLIGTYISPYTGERCPLIGVSELQHFDMGQVLVLNDRCRPVMGYLPDYSEYNFGENIEITLADIPEKKAYGKRKLFDLVEGISNPRKEIRESEQARNEKMIEEAGGLRATILAKREAIQNRGENPEEIIPEQPPIQESLTLDEPPIQETLTLDELPIQELLTLDELPIQESLVLEEPSAQADVSLEESETEEMEVIEEVDEHARDILDDLLVEVDEEDEEVAEEVWDLQVQLRKKIQDRLKRKKQNNDTEEE